MAPLGHHRAPSEKPLSNNDYTTYSCVTWTKWLNILLKLLRWKHCKIKSM